MKFLFVLMSIFLYCNASFAQEENNIYNARVMDVYDGDTITVEIPLLPGLTQISNIRLAGIDTPELKSHSLCEKEMAVKAGEYLSSLVSGKRIYLTGLKYDKFGGRYDAELFLAPHDPVSISSLMVDKGFAIRYIGKKKTHIWCVDQPK